MEKLTKRLILPIVLLAGLSACVTNPGKIKGLDGQSVYNGQIEDFKGQSTRLEDTSKNPYGTINDLDCLKVY